MSIRLINLFALAGPIVFMVSACDRSSEMPQEPRLDVDGVEQSSPVTSDDRAKFEASRPQGEKDETVAPSVVPKGESDDVVVGDATVPAEWFENASDHVRAQIMSWVFTIRKIDGKNLIGVTDENGDFVTWPGAKEFAEGDYPEGYIFIGFDDGADGATKSNEVRF